MSPSWRDEVAVHMSPRRLCMVRVGRALRPSVTAEHEQSIQGDVVAGWQKPLEALGELLNQPAWQDARLRIVLADCWVRYAIVPWVADLRSSVERMAHARQLFATTYGDAVSNWEVALSEAPPYRPRVACAMPAELPAEVRALCARNKIKLAGLQTQLLAAYENWRHCLPDSGAWFVTVGDGTLAAARIGERAWDRVHMVRIGSDWARELKRLHTFGRLASVRPDEGQVYVDAPLAWREVAGPAAKDLHWLEEEVVSPTILQRLGRIHRLGCSGAIAA